MFLCQRQVNQGKTKKTINTFQSFFFLIQSRQFYCKGNKLKIEEQKAFQVWRDDGLKCSWTLFLKNHLFFFKQQAPLLCLFSMLLLKHELACLSLHKSKAYQSFLPAPPPYPSGSALLCFWNLPALSNRAPPPPHWGWLAPGWDPTRGAVKLGGFSLWVQKQPRRPRATGTISASTQKPEREKESEQSLNDTFWTLVKVTLPKVK